VNIPTDGFVYVATGARYREEAARSAASLRAAHADARICLVTDRGEGPPFWDDLVLLERPVYGFRDKLAMRRCPYSRFCYLDCDTHIVGSLAELFQLLERFDVAGHQLFEGHDCPVPGIPDAFPEFQGGILAVRRSPATETFFDRWEELYDRHYALNRDGHYHYSNVSDQKTLRMALYESTLSLAVLGPEYDFTPAHVDFACATVRVLHGRGPLAGLAARLNRRLGNRVFVPELDSVLSSGMPPGELRRLWWMASLQLLRRAGVALTPHGLRDRLRASRAVRRLFLRNDYAEHHADHTAVWRKPSDRP
jgi:hypothetical protein